MKEEDIEITFDRVSAPEKLKFAKVVLAGIGILFCISMIIYGLLATSEKGAFVGEKIFDSAKIILAPLATLILGFYYSSKEKSQ